MSLTLDEIIGRIEDPATPVLWLDPSCPETIWRALPAALTAKTYRVLDLDPERPFDSLTALFARLAELLNSGPLREMADLAGAFERARGVAAGFVVLFRQPEALRHTEEGGFEEFLETLSLIDDAWNTAQTGVLKLVVRD